MAGDARAATGPAAGYRTDIRYTTHYQPELNPGRQLVALTAAGRAGADPNGAFTHLELGCGFGLSALFHAAAHPNARFVAVDILPEHMRWAIGVAEAAEIDNVQFICAPFAELGQYGLPKCDVVALHGVWSWINDDNRRHALAAVDRCLKDGGYTYISYNALPGLSHIGPLRDILGAEFRRAAGDVPARIAAAFARTQRLQQAGALFFHANPSAADHLEELPKAAPEYLAHELFNADWRSNYHGEVAAEMTRIGLSFAGSADLTDLADALTLPAESRALIEAERDPALRELVRDFMINRQFRADFFSRGQLPAAKATLADTRCALNIGPADFDRVVLRTVRKDFKPGVLARRIMTRLHRAPASPRELAGEAGFAETRLEQLSEAFVLLMAMGGADPLLSPDALAARRARTERLNRVIWAQSLVSGDVTVSVSPVTGAGVNTTRLEQLFLSAAAQGNDPVEFAAGLFDAAARPQVQEVYAAFVADRLPVLKNLGIA